MITPEEAVAWQENRVRELRLGNERVNKEMGRLPLEDRVDQIYCLFEGICPICGSDAMLISVRGTRRFLDEMVFIGDHEILECSSVAGDSGGVEFRCKNGHEHFVGYSFNSGDWS